MRNTRRLSLAWALLIMLGTTFQAQADSPVHWIEGASLSALEGRTIDPNQGDGFAEFPLLGGSGVLGHRLEYPSNELIKLCGISFDGLQERYVQGMYGPISLFAHMFARRIQVWESEVLTLIAECNPQVAGGLWKLSSDGLSVNESGIPKPDLVTRAAPQFDPQAHSFSHDLQVDPVNGLAFQTNSSTALLAMAAGMILLARFRRSRLMMG